MHAEQNPRQVALRDSGPRGGAQYHRCAAGTAMGARVGEKVTLALEAQPERRCVHRLPHHRHVMQRVVEAERKTHDQQRRADFDVGVVGEQVLRREGVSTPRFPAAPSGRFRSPPRRFLRPRPRPVATRSCRRRTAESKSRSTRPCCRRRRAVRSAGHPACDCSASSSITWRLVTRNRRPSRSKKKPVALVSGTSSLQVTTRVAVSSSESITTVHACPVTSRANRSIVVISRSCGSTPLYIHAKIQSIGSRERIASS